MLSSAFLFQSCKRNSSSNGSGCGPHTETYYYVSASDKALIPYNGKDTLKLQCNGGQIANFIGQGKDSGYNKVDASTVDCPGNEIHNRQYYTTKYVCSNYSLPLLLNLSFPTSDHTGYLSVTFDNKFFQIIISDIGVTKYQTSLFINGKQYSAIGMEPPANNLNDSIYFSKDYGIVKMISNGNIWAIIQ